MDSLFFINILRIIADILYELEVHFKRHNISCTWTQSLYSGTDDILKVTFSTLPIHGPYFQAQTLGLAHLLYSQGDSL